jgi:hypothetical protein
MMKNLIKRIHYYGAPKITAGFFLLLVLIYLICAGLSPIYKRNALNRLTKVDSVFISTYDSHYNIPILVPLSRQLAYKKALLYMSENDSINLVVNLHDSVLHLTIKGVIIHTTMIRSFDVDPLLLHLANNTYHKIFSQPQRIIEENATIVKEPVVVRQAPKDPEEAAINAYHPDTLIQNPAFLRMKLDYNFHLVFEQDINTNWEDKKTAFLFRANYLLPRLIENLKAFFSFKKQAYYPTISIKVPVNDLREIYRALPANARVVIYYL